jgi:hypothetical protein
MHYQLGDNGKKLKTFLRPPGKLVKQQKQRGIGKKQVHLDYAKKVQSVYQAVLSPPHFESVMNSRL